MLQKLSLKLLAGYQLYLRWFFPPSCRFVPSCSEYTRQAIEKYGFLRGIYKGARRILTCHPFSRKPVYDPLRL